MTRIPRPALPGLLTNDIEYPEPAWRGRSGRLLARARSGCTYLQFCDIVERVTESVSAFDFEASESDRIISVLSRLHWPGFGADELVLATARAHGAGLLRKQLTVVWSCVR
jgi:hypothetical protein